jgi:hypothetical protein
MINYLDNPDYKEPEIEMSQDFLYKDLRYKHPELKGVSKREYMNNKQLQEDVTGSRLDGTTWRDDLDFDEDLVIGQQSQDSHIGEEESVIPEEQTQFAFGGKKSTSGTGNRFTEFKGGGTHEENSLGGIPIGIGSNGKMNTVEEGETRYSFDDGDYIFSNRINTTGLLKDFSGNNNQFALGGDPGKKKEPDPKKFTEEYINSHLYREKLKKSGYKNINEAVKNRSSRVSSASVYDQNSTPNILEQFLNNVTDKPYSTSGSQYDPENNSIVLDGTTDTKNKFKLSREGTLAHELAHAETSQFGLNNRDIKELFDRQKTYNDPEDITSQKDKDRIRRNDLDKINHDLRPDENKADLNGFRFILNQEGIYDARKEQFTKEHLNKSKNNSIKNRLLKNYSEKDLIWLMNNVAQSNKDNNNVYS